MRLFKRSLSLLLMLLLICSSPVSVFADNVTDDGEIIDFDEADYDEIIEFYDTYADSKPQKDVNYIFIGDSRTVGLRHAVKYDNVNFIAKGSQSYKYMRQIFPSALKKVDPDKKNIIVSWFGINGPAQAKLYADFFNSVKLPPNTMLVQLSITDGVNYRGRKINIKDFNKTLENNANNYVFIDLTDEIGRGKAIDCTDKARLHYTKNSKEVFDVIMEKLNFEIDY